MNHRRRKLGFTLLELLLALSILSIILVVILGALRVTVRAWEKGESVLSTQQRSRTILDQLKRQLGSAVVLTSGSEEQALVAFTGTERSIEFTSNLPLVSKTQAAPVHITYRIESGPDKERLLLYEEAVTLEDYLSETQLTHHTDPHVLTKGINDLRFDYLGEVGTEEGLSWTTTWQSQSSTDLPRAVRITSRTEADEPPIRVIAKFHLWQRFRAEPEQ